MRYNSHSRAFRNRIARHLGVLVAAALIATLGLPSAAQAQKITEITFADNAGFTVKWETRLNTTVGDFSWIVTFTKPNGDKVVVNEHSSLPDAMELGTSVGERGMTGFTYNRNDTGTWWVQVDACLVAIPDMGDKKNVCPSTSLESGTSKGYTHGPPTAPENFAASIVPGGVALTWTAIKGDEGISGYEYSLDDFKTMKGAGTTGAYVVAKVDPGEKTFMLRAIGESDNSTATDPGAAVPGAASSATVSVPMPTPTLPEIALLLLVMLLLGSGAYLLRRRQSGDLTHA